MGLWQIVKIEIKAKGGKPLQSLAAIAEIKDVLAKHGLENAEVIDKTVYITTEA